MKKTLLNIMLLMIISVCLSARQIDDDTKACDNQNADGCKAYAINNSMQNKQLDQ